MSKTHLQISNCKFTFKKILSIKFKTFYKWKPVSNLPLPLKIGFKLGFTKSIPNWDLLQIKTNFNSNWPLENPLVIFLFANLVLEGDPEHSHIRVFPFSRSFRLLLSGFVSWERQNKTISWTQGRCDVRLKLFPQLFSVKFDLQEKDIDLTPN